MHGWVITSHNKQWMWSTIHAILLDNVLINGEPLETNTVILVEDNKCLNIHSRIRNSNYSLSNDIHLITNSVMFECLLETILAVFLKCADTCNSCHWIATLHQLLGKVLKYNTLHKIYTQFYYVQSYVQPVVILGWIYPYSLRLCHWYWSHCNIVRVPLK